MMSDDHMLEILAQELNKTRGPDQKPITASVFRDPPGESVGEHRLGANVGWWKSCSGCTEAEDGYVNPRDYPDHPKYPGVPRGCGCSECKGRGIVFFHFTKADAEWCERQAREI